MLNVGAGVIGREDTWVIGTPLMGALLGVGGWYPSCHGLRFTIGMVIASHGTRGFLKINDYDYMEHNRETFCLHW